MKKLLLLLFIPFVSFGQDLDFDDIKQIDSEKQFKRVMLEGGLVKAKSRGENMIMYAYNYQETFYPNGGYNEKASMFAKMFGNGLMQFNVAPKSDGGVATIYSRILEQVKRECTFYDIYNGKYGANDLEYICYTCPDSKYKGKIGFARNAVWNWIETFDF